MRRTENRFVPMIVISCDLCGKDSAAGTGGVRNCYICRKDVCYKCSIVTDSEYLQPGSFIGDHPDHFCNDCWERGKEIRESIISRRRTAEAEEEVLWEKWREL